MKYCDHCRKVLGDKKVVQRRGKMILTFCNWTCAYNSLKQTQKKRRSLAHLTPLQKEELKERLHYSYFQYIQHYLNKNDIDGVEFTDIVLCDEPQKRRDEFYKLFKDENDADCLWTRLMGWYYGYTEEEIEAEMWETLEHVHRVLGIYDKPTLLCGDEN